MAIKRGKVYYSNLDDRGEGIINGTRPVLVVQNNTGNRYSKTIIVVPITSNTEKHLPTHVPLALERPSVALCEQITVVRKEHLFAEIYTLTEAEMAAVEKAILASLDIKGGTNG